MRFAFGSATLGLALAAGPALAAGETFFSLTNTDFVVLLAFLLFLGVLVYFKVPRMLAGLLDRRAAKISEELEEARGLREEAQSLLASYERQQQDVKAQADRIVETARKEAEAAAQQAREDLKVSIARRLQGAEDQIASAEAKAVRQVRDRAITVAVAAAREVLAQQMTGEKADAMIDASIETVGKRLH